MTTPASLEDPQSNAATAASPADRGNDADQTEETRARILAEAEHLFRTLGYNKTTIADIARASGMSPGNVYRFFSAKADLMGQIAARWLAVQDAEGAEIAYADGPAEQRLYDFVRFRHLRTRERHIQDRKVDELCALVIREHWPAVLSHIARFREAVAHVLADGVREGVFVIDDVEETARLLCASLVKFNHPEMIAEFLHEDLETEVVDVCRLIVRGFKAR